MTSSFRYNHQVSDLSDTPPSALNTKRRPCSYSMTDRIIKAEPIDDSYDSAEVKPSSGVGFHAFAQGAQATNFAPKPVSERSKRALAGARSDAKFEKDTELALKLSMGKTTPRVIKKEMPDSDESDSNQPSTSTSKTNNRAQTTTRRKPNNVPVRKQEEGEQSAPTPAKTIKREMQPENVVVKREMPELPEECQDAMRNLAGIMNEFKDNIPFMRRKTTFIERLQNGKRPEENQVTAEIDEFEREQRKQGVMTRTSLRIHKKKEALIGRPGIIVKQEILDEPVEAEDNDSDVEYIPPKAKASSQKNQQQRGVSNNIPRRVGRPRKQREMPVALDQIKPEVEDVVMAEPEEYVPGVVETERPDSMERQDTSSMGPSFPDDSVCETNANNLHDANRKEVEEHRRSVSTDGRARQTNAEIDQAILENPPLSENEMYEMAAHIEQTKSQMHEDRTEATDESQRRENENRDLHPTNIHNTPPKDTRPEGDKKDQGMSSTSSKRRNTNNSRSASLLSMPAVTRASAVLDSDDDSDDGEMSSTGDPSDHSKRPRTPRGRYSPDAQRRTNSRLTMSALSIDTYRNTDLNADGSGPSSSSAASHSQFTPEAERASTSHKKKSSLPLFRTRKIKSPVQPLSSQDDDSDSQLEDELRMQNLCIFTDDPNFKITDRMRFIYKSADEAVKLECDLCPKEIAEAYSSAREGEQARLPKYILIGMNKLGTWYGSPFPAEFIKCGLLYVCEFCLFYARSDMIMQNHAKKCWLRAPPGIEIYRKGCISVFEVDGRKQKWYCQTLCLISRMFLESKTVFYDTEPFFFYVVTVNDEIGCHFAGYFSKEKYEPDINNLSCIMTLPHHQDKGLGRFLIDLSYALSRMEGWNGGPEQPLSDLGRRAYGGYWKTAISVCLAHFKNDLENGPGLSINMIADHTGINSHDVLEVLGALQWIRPVKLADKPTYTIEWDVDWDMVENITKENKANTSGKVQFDEECLDWEPRRMRPSMDGYHELTREEIEEDEMKRRNHLLKTPIHESMQKALPTSTSMPCGSVKKELRSRGHNRSVGRNLKLELPKKIKVPETADVKDVTDEETKEDEKKKLQRKIKKSLSRCSESAPNKEKNREETPDDDEPGPSTKPIGRRPRSNRGQEDLMEPSTSEHKTPSVSSGKGRHRTRSIGGKFEDADEPTDSDPATSDDDDRPFGSTGHKGKNGKVHRGRRGSKKKKSVSGKNFPKNFGVRPVPEKSDETVSIPGLAKLEEKLAKIEEYRNDEAMKESNAENTDAEKTAGSDMEGVNEYAHLHPTEEELAKNYNIGTPESYHSTPPLSPQPQIMPGQQLDFGADDDNQFEDIAPPLLVSEVAPSKNSESLDDGQSDAPPLVQNMEDGDGYSSGDDDAPPRLSPQYKNEDHDEEMAPLQPQPSVATTAPPPVQQASQQQNGMSYEEPQSYHNPMSAGPGPSSAMHVTPQMNQMPNSQQNMMTPTPQQHYSQPNSHQQATPGSGGIPSCGPVYNHSTPEQLQNQQFMSPQMAGMPASVSSVHSVHNNNSMEMVGGPASLQHTPQQQYDIGHPMGQMPQENVQMVNNVQSIEQQNQMMMQQHGFNSPPMPQIATPQQHPQQQQIQQQQVIPPQQQQVPPPPLAAPVAPAPATTNGRRRSESAATNQRKQRQRNTPATTAAQPVVPSSVAYSQMHMMPQMQMQAYPFYGYPGYPPMAENGFYYNTAYYPGVFPMQPMNPQFNQWNQMAAFNNQQMQEGNGTAAAGPANYPFPPGTAGQMQYFQHNTR